MKNTSEIHNTLTEAMNSCSGLGHSTEHRLKTARAPLAGLHSCSPGEAAGSGERRRGWGVTLSSKPETVVFRI